MYLFFGLFLFCLLKIALLIFKEECTHIGGFLKNFSEESQNVRVQWIIVSKISNAALCEMYRKVLSCKALLTFIARRSTFHLGS